VIDSVSLCLMSEGYETQTRTVVVWAMLLAKPVVLWAGKN